MKDYYHYQQCGLPNVFLANGYKHKDTPYGAGVSIENVEGLHDAIGMGLVDKPNPLSGEEFRFLRKELEMSQKRLGELLGRDAQSVATWEKKDEVGEFANYLIRHIYKQTKGDRSGYVELVDHLNELDRQEHFQLMFEESNHGWKKTG